MKYQLVTKRSKKEPIEDITPFSVSEITDIIRDLLEAGLPQVMVTGEISNFTHHSSGHMYFSLKDENATLRTVMFRGMNQYLQFKPKNGMKVIAYGDISVYPPHGSYQLNVKQMFAQGMGDLQRAFEQLKQKLYDEGLFEPTAKKTLPPFPRVIGVITSPTGAAVRDIIHVIRRRAAGVQLILRPVRVQGEGAALEIARAIGECNQYGQMDVLIVGRGGGSLEDLWAFNEEVVARAIYQSEIPIISAVGHEIDFTISDFVADVRAPTPSAAAEIVVPNSDEVVAYLENVQSQLQNRIQHKLKSSLQRLNQIQKHPILKRPQQYIHVKSQKLDDLTASFQRITRYQFEQKNTKFKYLVKIINSVNPLTILTRGYSVVRKLPEQQIICRSDDLQIKDMVHIQFGEGEAECQVISIHQPSKKE